MAQAFRCPCAVRRARSPAPPRPPQTHGLCYADPDGSGQQSDSGDYDARTWDQFLVQTEPVSASVPWMVTTGNHDMEAGYPPNGYGGQEARWSLPANGHDPKNQPGAYSFVYGNTAVIALDANDVSYEIPANYAITGGRQTAWLDSTPGAYRKQGGIDFLVVFFHHCAYSTTDSHASDGGVQAEWVPLFEKHQVDLVINGHNHVYERADAMRGGAVPHPVAIGGTTRPATDGVVYITAGGAGRSLYDFPAPDTFEGNEHPVDTPPGTRPRAAARSPTPSTGRGSAAPATRSSRSTSNRRTPGGSRR